MNDNRRKNSRTSHRTDRVADQIRKEVASFLVDGIKNDQIGFVTITDVKVTPDLQTARILYTSYGDENQKKTSADALNDSVGKIRTHLGKALRMRYTPRLEFFPDVGLEHSFKIQNLLNQVHNESAGQDDDTQGDETDES